MRERTYLVIATLTLSLWGAIPPAHALERSVDTNRPRTAPSRLPTEKEYLRAGMAASVRDLDSTLSDTRFASWIQRALGWEARVRWTVNDCGEASGSPSDSACDLPVCVEASSVLSGGRELYASVVVGTQSGGRIDRPAFWWAAICAPDTFLSFDRLSDLERYIASERPVIGDARIYLDERRNVHVVTSADRDVRLTKDGRYQDPKLSPDGRSIGMLALSWVDRGGGQAPELIEVAKELWIYRGGRVIRRIEPGGFIRAWSFANGGNAVAIYSGALHFAGFYALYDIKDGIEIERASDPVTDRSPEWVLNLSR